MEFQAVVLAGGPGSRMTDLTTATPKALLPVANMPMVWYPVNMLQNAGFQDAIVIVTESQKDSIQKSLVEICQVKISLDFVSIPDNMDWGTAEALRFIANKIKTDLLVVSCDLITDVQLHLIADLHRTKEATVTALMSPLPNVTDAQVPGGKTYRKTERDYVGLDENGTHMLFLSSEADLDESISFRQSFLRDHPFVDLRSNLLDAHLYLMKRCVLDFLKEEDTITTIKGELLPKLVRRQFSTKSQKEASKSELSTSTEDIFSKYAKEMSTYPQSNQMPSKIKCFAYVMETGFCMRTNNILMYCEANRRIPKSLVDQTAVHSSVSLKKSTVGADSIVGESTSIGEKITIKKSIIGRHCNIKDKVKITNSIIMDYCVIDEGCTISGCVLGNNTEIGEKCEIKDTLVGPNQKVNPMGQFTNEAIVELDRMMEI